MLWKCIKKLVIRGQLFLHNILIWWEHASVSIAFRFEVYSRATRVKCNFWLLRDSKWWSVFWWDIWSGGIWLLDWWFFGYDTWQTFLEYCSGFKSKWWYYCERLWDIPNMVDFKWRKSFLIQSKSIWNVWKHHCEHLASQGRPSLHIVHWSSSRHSLGSLKYSIYLWEFSLWLLQQSVIVSKAW